VTEVPVTFVSSHAQLGGSEVYLMRLLDELGPEWIRGVICLQDGPLVERLRAAGRPAHVIEVGTSPPALVEGGFRLRAHLKRAPAVLLHANGIKAGVVCAIAAGRFVWAKHDFSWDGWLARAVAKRACMVVAASRAVAAAVEGVAQVEIVPPGISEPVVDRGEAGKRLRAELGLDPSAPVVVQIGRIHPAKGQLELVRAAEMVHSRRPDTAFVIVGETDPSALQYATLVGAEIAERGLEDRFHLLGHRDDPFAVLAGSDVCAIPTTRDERGMGEEGFGLVATEAMAVGTPVVAYASGALPDVLADCGICVASDDPSALAGGIERVLGDDDLARHLGTCGRDRARSHFSAAAMADGMRTVYERCTA